MTSPSGPPQGAGGYPARPGTRPTACGRAPPKPQALTATADCRPRCTRWNGRSSRSSGSSSARTCSSSGCWSGCSPRATCCSRACPASPRRWRSRRSPRWSAARSRASSSPPTWCPPTSSVPASTGQGKEEFDIELGPVVVNFLLADEINRAPAKVQSALLEVMAERKISIGGKTFPLPNPFLVMATQNPIEQEGVYALPEAQRDRFLFKLNVDYPTPEEEREIIYRMGVTPPEPKQILDPGDLLRLQDVAANNFVHHALVDYVVRVVTATRAPEKFGMPDAKAWIAYGASPRASLGIIAASRALALVRGRDYVDPAGRRRGHPRRAAAPPGADLRRARRRDLRGDGDQPDPADRRPAAGERHSAARPFGAARSCPPQRPRPAVGDYLSGRNVDLPSLKRGEIRDPAADGGAAQARADGAPQARRRAARRPPRPAARARFRAGGVAALPARRRRAPDGLVGDRAHHASARAADDRRPRAGDLAGGRHVGQPRLRHHRLREARPRGGGGSGDHVPQQRRRQPDRRDHRQRRRRCGGCPRCPAACTSRRCCAPSRPCRRRRSACGATWPPPSTRCAGPNAGAAWR